LNSYFGPWFKLNKDALHGFTHGGIEQIARRGTGTDIFANYREDEIRDVLYFTNMFAYLTAILTMDALGFTDELSRGTAMFEEFMRTHQPPAQQSK
jgi:hypothetical protein